MKQFLIILAIGVTTLFAFDYVPVIKLLAVFFHESSHAIMTFMTGGDVASFVVNSNASGMVMSRGGNRFLILNSGYLGSLIWGLAILYAAATVRPKTLVMDGLIAVVSIIILVWVRDAGTVIIAGCFIVVWMVVRIVVPEQAMKYALYVVACIPIAYIPMDIWGDVIVHNGRSDAYMLAEEYGGTKEMWGIVWLALSITLTYKTIREITSKQ